ncbi:MAG TPA: 16S rRNA (guanine(527)-N(7))-methyltransferase RsmG [Xanthomonadaceae bacterium]|nr:16S rRNA (guanine(527)-N(7))-methyltransferase RsmG [Xanthomonadaceae bacterium]
MTVIERQRPELQRGLDTLRLPADTGVVDALLAYLALLIEWNRAYNLTAVREPTAMLRLHLLDSLSVAPHLHGDRLSDIGSGAGLPGIPLALIHPARQVRLVESNGKKARFLRQAVRSLSLGNVEVLQARAEAVPADPAQDAVIARAVSSLVELVRLGGHMLKADGELLAMKGRMPQDEIDALPAGWTLAAVHELTVPGLDAERHLLVLRRNAAD